MTIGGRGMVTTMLVPVAVAQIPITWSVPANVRVIEEVINEVEPGTLLVLPEAAISGYDDTLSRLDDLAPEELADAYRVIAAAATDTGVHVVCGSLLHEVGRWWNAGLYFAPGRHWWIYRKINLAMHERGRLSAGSELPTVDLELPAGRVTAGVQLCREIRFPEQWHQLARAGAQLLMYLTYAANPAEPAGVWRAHLISRAAETQRYLVAANVADPAQHCPTMIISPRGEVLAEITYEPGIIRHQLDLTLIMDNYLKHQRNDVVSIEYHASR